MFSKKLAALAAMSVVLGTSPGVAQTAASKLSPIASLDRAQADLSEASQMGDGYGGNGIWVALIGAALLAAFILVVIDDEDELVNKPVSP